MAHKVKFIVYTRYENIFGEEDEITEEEENIDEYETYEEAEREADKDSYGWAGTYVEVYIDGEFYRDYEQY